MDIELLTTQQTARYLGVTRWTLQHWRKNKLHLPFIKVGHFIRYKKKDLEDFLKDKKILIDL